MGIRWGGASGTTLYHDHSTAWTGTDEAALRATWVQGLRPSDNDDEAFPQQWQRRPTPMLLAANDGDSAETTTDPDALRVLENRADVDPSWDPIVQGVQVQAAGRGHGTLDKAAVTMELGGTLVAGTTLQLSGAHGMPFRDEIPGGGSWTGTDLDNLLAGYRVSSWMSAPNNVHADGLVVAVASPSASDYSAEGLALEVAWQDRQPELRTEPRAFLLLQDPGCGGSKAITSATSQEGPHVATAYAETENEGDLLPFATGQWDTDAGTPDPDPDDMLLQVVRTGSLYDSAEWAWKLDRHGHDRWVGMDDLRAGSTDLKTPRGRCMRWQARPRSCTARCTSARSWRGSLEVRSSVPGAKCWAAPPGPIWTSPWAPVASRWPWAPWRSWSCPTVPAAPVLPVHSARSWSDRQRPGRVGQPGRGRDVGAGEGARDHRRAGRSRQRARRQGGPQRRLAAHGAVPRHRAHGLVSARSSDRCANGRWRDTPDGTDALSADTTRAWVYDLGSR